MTAWENMATHPPHAPLWGLRLSRHANGHAGMADHTGMTVPQGAGAAPRREAETTDQQLTGGVGTVQMRGVADTGRGYALAHCTRKSSYPSKLC